MWKFKSARQVKLNILKNLKRKIKIAVQRINNRQLNQ